VLYVDKVQKIQGYARRFSVLGLVEGAAWWKKSVSMPAKKKQIGASCDSHDELHSGNQLLSGAREVARITCVKLHPDSRAPGAACWWTAVVGCGVGDRPKKKKDNTNIGLLYRACGQRAREAGLDDRPTNDSHGVKWSDFRVGSAIQSD